MKLAHVRERNAPAGSPWRLAAALPDGRWLDLEVARRRRIAEMPELPHMSVRFRQPVTTLDAHLALGLRVEALSPLVEPFAGDPGRVGAPPGDESDDLALDAADFRFGPPILEPPSLRDFYGFEQHVATVWHLRGGEVPEAWYRLPVFYFSNTSGIRGPDQPVWAPGGSSELDYELEVAALVDTPASDLPVDRAEEAIGGYMILNDWSARDLQRDETTVRLGPAKGKDFATTIGPWLVTPDELADRRTGKGFDLAMTATVGGAEISRGTWASIAFSFGDMLARASADVRLRPGDLVGSGTVGTGCLLEVGRERLGRWLRPGDRVELAVERLGALQTPIVDRPGAGT
ncbi:MAG: fumarylacetoacetate hydrolase family protein [Candidatus Limnocylindrales bacterium]